MRKSCLVFLLLVTALALAAGDRHMTIEDSLAVKAVGAPQFSPDGKTIAYTLSEWAREQDTRVSHIYLTSADGQRSVRLTNGEKGESSPRWSPDGRKIAFTANRDKGNQVWVINPDGGEAERVTSEESGVNGFSWAPDSRRLAFVTQDVPGDKDQREKRKKDKFDTIVVDRELIYSHLWMIDSQTREKKRLTRGDFSVSSPQWSPDGKWIAYVTASTAFQESKYKDISADRNTDIMIIPADGGAPRKLTANPGADTNPEWSPDGGAIAYLASGDASSWAAKTDLMVIPVQGGTPRNLTRAFFESAGGAAWSPDGQSLYFSAGIGVTSQLCSVPASGGSPRQITQGDRLYGQFDLAAGGKSLACLLETAKTPGDIWVRDLMSGQEQQVTFANPQVKEFALAESEVMRWKGPENFDVEGVLTRPLDYQAGKRYPLILQIHGGPYGRFSNGFNTRVQIFSANGYAVLMPNPRGSTGYGIQFTTANVGDWGGKDFQDYMAGVDAAIARGIADPDRLVVMGGSYGGFSTFWTITQTNRFKAAIGHAGISDWYSFHGQSDIPGLMEYGFAGYPWTAAEVYRKYSPMTYVDRVKTPIMITHGEEDRRVPIAQAEEYYRALKSRGVEVVFVRYPREGHGIQEPNHQIDLVQRQLEWFDKHLGIERPKKTTEDRAKD